MGKMAEKRAVPCAFALMCDKETHSYSLVWDKLLEVVNFPEDKPQRIMLDYERAVWNTIAEKLPTVQISGCYFHQMQARLQ
jgi:MULE transposase domain